MRFSKTCKLARKQEEMERAVAELQQEKHANEARHELAAEALEEM